MKRISIRTGCLLLTGLLTVFPLSACSSSPLETPDATAIHSTDKRLPYEGPSSLRFAYDAQQNQFTVTDSRSGKVWSNGLSDDYYTEEIYSDVIRLAKMSLFTVTYVDETNNLIALRSTDEGVLVTVEGSGNDIRLAVDLSSAEIQFAIEMTLQSNTLTVTVPADSISENKNRLVALELLPYFGASINEEDGYIFYPDGSGALSRFKENTRSLYPVRQQIYGDNFEQVEEYTDGASTGQKWIMMPVFGVKQGDSAIVGIVSAGAADTSLCFAPSGYIYQASRVYPIFNYRYAYSVQAVSNGNTAGGGTAEGEAAGGDSENRIVVYERERSTADFQVQYTFLDGTDANYSGMARTYRQYLLHNDMLNKSEELPDVMLDMLITVKKPMLLWEESVVASSFSYGNTILQELHDAGVGKMRLNLLGWQSEGYNRYPAHFPVASSAGGNSDLRELLRLVQALDSRVALTDNFIEADDGQGGYSRRDDLSYNLLNQTYSNLDRTKFLMDFRQALRLFNDKWLPRAQSLEVQSVSLDNIGRLLYPNGSTSSPQRRDSAAASAAALVKSAREGLGDVSVSGANEYVLANATSIYGLPETSSQSFTFDESVPFVQIVLHGYLPYAPEIPGNLSADFNQTVLKWAEYGYTPYFSVAEHDASILSECDSQGVFISAFSDKKQDIVDTVKLFEEKLAAVQGLPISDHAQLDNSLVRVTYEGGAQLLVNYGSSPADYEGQPIAAGDFTVILPD